MPFRFLYHSANPPPSQVVGQLCDILGYVRTTDVNSDYHVAMLSQPMQHTDDVPSIPEGLCEDSTLNASFRRLSSQQVRRSFQEIAGDSQRLDASMEGDDHDRTPCQYRVPVCGNDIPFVYCVDRLKSQRSGSRHDRSGISEVDQALSVAEQRFILRFCRVAGLDFGELAAVRCTDGRIEVCDATASPQLPPEKLADHLQWEARLRLAESFAHLVRRRARREERSIAILQSCDDTYFKFLDIVSESNAAYASMHGYAYRAEVGNFGPTPGTGNWNRYYLLKQEIDRGIHDWAFWMDADAVVRDRRIRLEPIIDRTPDKMLIACNGGNGRDHNINNGVFLLNLRHVLARQLVDFAIDCSRRLEVNKDVFQADQPSMHQWLMQHYDGRGRIPFVKRYSGREYNLFNFDGEFVSHVLREHGPPEKRREKLKKIVARSNATNSAKAAESDCRTIEQGNGKTHWWQGAPNSNDLVCRDRRQVTFKLALHLFDQSDGRVIVETGCVRQREDRGDGGSTILFAEFLRDRGGVLYSIDNNPQHIVSADKRLRALVGHETEDFRFECVCDDSVEFLASALRDQPHFSGKIDLLYLDSLDYPLDRIIQSCPKNELPDLDEDAIVDRCPELVLPSQQHCADELLAAKDLLHSTSIVLIDDNDLVGGGKSRLAKRLLRDWGWMCVFDAYQTVWIPNPFGDP